MEALTMQIVFPNGNTNGIKIIELTDWNGKAFAIPRAELGSLKERNELKESGLYFLFGEDEGSGDQLVYVGESGDCFGRLSSHDVQKDYWNLALVFLLPPNRNYLESISAKLAKEAGRYIVKNSTQPKEENQNEFDRIKNERYFGGLKKILSALDFPVFESIKELTSDKPMYYLKADAVDARAQLLDDGTLNVLAGATSRIRESDSFWGWSQRARKQFLQDGTIIEKGDGISYVFTKDTLFKSPSAAAATLTGRPINGWTSWKDEQGNTMDVNLRS
jgi:hypothetical protein